MTRAWFLIPIVLGSLLIGLFAFDQARFRQAHAEKRAAARAQARQARAGGGRQIGPVTLEGPGGATVTLPTGEPVVVNVWLQACPDCMPRFEASQALALQGEAWPKPLVNVAYGRANPDWAQQYGVAENLVIDGGAAIVRPLGIGTFTTLVLDGAGRVVHTDYVDREGFRERVVAALEKAGSAAPPAAPTPAPAPLRPAPPPSLKLDDPRFMGGLALLALGIVGAPVTLLLLRPGANQSGVLEPWMEDAVVSGVRCPSCAGRFQEPREVRRCAGCDARYHAACARKVGHCETKGCGKPLRA